MKERPIKFSGEMVRAILEGRKTQTRRIVKDPINLPFNPKDFKSNGNGLFRDHGNGNVEFYPICHPFGAVGDCLWVKEEFWFCGDDERHAIHFEADKPGFTGFQQAEEMLREYSRIDLEIKDVRVERLQNISEEDAIAEGFNQEPITPLLKRTAKSALLEYFAQIYSWDLVESDPWVWVIEFERVEK